MIHLKKSGQRVSSSVTRATRQAKAAELFYALYRTVTMKRGPKVIRVVGTASSIDGVVEHHVGMGWKVIS